MLIFYSHLTMQLFVFFYDRVLVTQLKLGIIGRLAYTTEASLPMMPSSSCVTKTLSQKKIKKLRRRVNAR